MFCTNCGVELPANAQFCVECGTRTEVEVVSAAARAGTTPQPSQVGGNRYARGCTRGGRWRVSVCESRGEAEGG